jgi:TetR/AcrR family transcriptional regulator, regulator of cefoperazone and chloramphenicol sensitivity
MHDLATHDPQAVTRQRLLEAAGEVFAEKGFRSATIRDICKLADANVAAVKYHFGDKERLYAAAVRYAHTCGVGTSDDAVRAVAAATTPHARLVAFVRFMLRGILDTGKPAWHAKIVTRELAEPTKVLDMIAEEGVKPRFKLLSEIVRSVLGDSASDVLVMRCAHSIVGQVLFYHFARPMLARVFPAASLDLEALAEHIATFSLGGIEAMKEEPS